MLNCEICQTAAEFERNPEPHSCNCNAIALVGKKITNLLVNARKNELFFVTSNCVVKIEAYAECCSTTWFNDILGVDALIGRTVYGVEDVDYEDIKNDKDYLAVRHHGLMIRTDSGIVTIQYRNGSEGYYDGAINEAEIIDYESLPVDLKEITDDWSAT